MDKNTQIVFNKMTEQFSDTGTRCFLTLMKNLATSLTMGIAVAEDPLKAARFAMLADGMEEEAYMDVLGIFMVNQGLQTVQEEMETELVQAVARVMSSRREKRDLMALYGKGTHCEK